MKTMNYLLAITLLLLLGSCSKEAPIENEELAETNFKGRMYQEEEEEEEETQEVFEVDLRQAFLLGQIGKLEQEKRSLEDEIEKGNRKLIPLWEETVDQIDKNIKILDITLDDTCLFLRYEVAQLEKKLNGRGGPISPAERNSLKERLEIIKERLEYCETSAKDYVKYGIIILAIRKGKSGDICIPTRDFSCTQDFSNEELLINVLDKDRSTQILQKTQKGRMLSKGQIKGPHPDYNGVSQISIGLKQVDNGILAIENSVMSLDLPINVN